VNRNYWAGKNASMTEAEWQRGACPQTMLDCEQMDGASSRKLRLFTETDYPILTRDFDEPRGIIPSHEASSPLGVRKRERGFGSPFLGCNPGDSGGILACLRPWCLFLPCPDGPLGLGY
jgi:hypothetical protein